MENWYQRYASDQKFFSDIFFKGGNCFLFNVLHKLSAAVSAPVILFSGMDVTVFSDVSGIAFRAVHKKFLSLNIAVFLIFQKS